LASALHQDILDLLALKPHTIWSYRRFDVHALHAAGRMEDALAYAEESRGLNVPNSNVDAECERILLEAGRTR
jgi:hypothetical protein